MAQLFESNSFGTEFLISNEGPISTETVRVHSKLFFYFIINFNKRLIHLKRQENQLNTSFLNDEYNINQPHNFLELFKNQ